MDDRVLPSSTSCTKKLGLQLSSLERNGLLVLHIPQKWYIRCCEVWSADGMMESGCGGACFPLRASRVASFRRASVSSELANLTAFLDNLAGRTKSGDRDRLSC